MDDEVCKKITLVMISIRLVRLVVVASFSTSRLYSSQYIILYRQLSHLVLRVSSQPDRIGYGLRGLIFFVSEACDNPYGDFCNSPLAVVRYWYHDVPEYKNAEDRP